MTYMGMFEDLHIRISLKVERNENKGKSNSFTVDPRRAPSVLRVFFLPLPLPLSSPYQG